MHNKITEISYKNFKCHSKIQEKISDLTILTGSNATGKSSVIQGILISFLAWKNADNKSIQTRDVYGIDLGLPETIISEEHDDNLIHLNIKIDKVDNNVILGLSDAEYGDISFEILNREEIIEKRLEKKNLNKINLFYLNAERIGPRIKGDISHSETMYVGSKGENTNYTISKMDKMQKLEEKWKICKDLKISKIERFSSNCEEWLNVIIPGTKLQVEEDLEMNQSKIKFINNGDAYLPTATGFGITYVLPIIVQALIASMYENPILIVENPEAHLHPYSQSAIGKFLALVSLSGVQILIETHSEHVINGCRVQLAHAKSCDKMTTVFFNKKNYNSGYQVIKTLDNGELVEWPEGFFDQNRNDLRELLEMRRCGN